MTMSNKVYDVLRAIATIILPALGTLYAALAVIWGLPFPDQVTGTVLATVTFMNALLKLSSIKYNAAAPEEGRRYAEDDNPGEVA